MHSLYGLQKLGLTFQLKGGTSLRSIVCLSVAMLLSGCAVGPDFLRPATPKAGGYAAEAMPGKTAAANTVAGKAQTFVTGQEIQAEWWKIFRSEPLNKLVASALKANPDLQAAEASLRQARELLYAQESGFLPSADASTGVSRQKNSAAAFGQPNVGGSVFALHNASVNVSYRLDIFGKLRREVEALNAQAEAERYRYEAAYVTLTANVVAAAIKEAALREKIRETQAIITIEQDQLKVLNAQFKLGSIARSGVLAQEASAAQTRATLPPLQKQLAQVRNQLAVLAGQPPSQALNEKFHLSSLSLPEEIPVSLPSCLIEQRPDIRVSEALLHAASAEIGVATANMLPQMNITGSYGSAAATAGSMFSPATIVWNIGAGLTQPLFNGGQLNHRKRAAVAAYEKIAAQYKATVLEAFQDVADSLRALQYDADTLRAQAEAAEAASRSLGLATKKFTLGAIDSIELLDARRTYRQSRIALVQAQGDRFADSAALFQALGGGWWNKLRDKQMKRKSCV